MHIKGELGAELQLAAVVSAGLSVDGAFPAEAVPGRVFQVVRLVGHGYEVVVSDAHSDASTTTSKHSRGVAEIRDEQEMAKEPPARYV